MYEIRFEDHVEDELAALGPFDGRRILDAIVECLSHEPHVETRQRKILKGIKPPFHTVPPTWELRVGEHRVFYDVSAEGKVVYVRAVRRKPPHRTTEEIL